MGRIFLAYHLSDLGEEFSSYKEAEKLRGDLRARGCDCFLHDYKNSAKSFAETPDEAAKCERFIFVINKGVFEKCETNLCGNGKEKKVLRKDSHVYDEIRGFLTQYNGVTSGKAKGKIVCYCTDGEVGDVEIGDLHLAFDQIKPIRDIQGLFDWISHKDKSNLEQTPRQKFMSAVRNNVTLYYNKEQDEYEIDKRLESYFIFMQDKQSDDVVVLWDARPVNEINILHLIYLMKLKELSHFGITPKILIFDDTELRETKVNAKNNKLNTSMTISYFEKFLGIKGCCVVESQLSEETTHREFIGFLAQYLDFINDNYKNGKSLINDLNEIFYEQEKIQNSMLLVGEGDKKSVWDNAFVKDDDIPLILEIKNINGYNGKEVRPTSCENLISMKTVDNVSKEEFVNSIFASQDEESVKFAQAVNRMVIEPFMKYFNVPSGFDEMDKFEQLKIIFDCGRSDKDGNR